MVEAGWRGGQPPDGRNLIRRVLARHEFLTASRRCCLSIVCRRPRTRVHGGSRAARGSRGRIDALGARVLAEHVDDHGPWSYTTVVAETGSRLALRVDGLETTAAQWIDVTAATQLRLHPSLCAHWPALLDRLEV